MRKALLFLLLAATAVLTGVSVSSSAAEVTVVSRPPSVGENPFYVGNREPLLPNRLLKLSIGAIEPRGWLGHQLELARDGMVGQLAELSRWCKPDDNAWLSPTGAGKHGWEELPYWLKGYGDLGYVLGDEEIMAAARVWIDAVLGSQRDDGYFGPASNLTNVDGKPDLWPNMIMVNVLQSFHEATGDERVVPFLLKYFRWQQRLPREQFLHASWQKIRAGDNLESIFWTYNRTGQEWLLDLAHRVHEQTVRWDEGVANWHGVNICQGFREPAQYFMLSQDRKDWDASERVYRTVMTLYGQVPGGMFGADENCRGGYHGPRQAAETCSMVEFMHSFEMLLGLSGDPTYADRCEDVAFNSLPAAMTPDAKALRYLTAPNMVRSDRYNKAPGVQNSGCMFAFSPDERYRCCQHNVSHGWPYYAEHLWMATRDCGLAVVLYAASAVTATVGAGDGVEVRIEESTAYPFEEAVRMRVSTAKSVTFPLYVRIPRWCVGAAVSVNGSWLDVKPGPLTNVRIEREWADGDTVEVELPMAIEVKTWETNGDSVSVLRGPLAYSLKIEGYWGTFDGTETWPNFELVSQSPWHYGLIVDETQPATSFEVVRQAGPLEPQPFKPDAAPIALKARGKRISNWQEDYLGLVGPVPPSPVKSAEPAEDITLIPMGCTRLRIAAFPRIGEGPDAREAPVPRPPRHLASVDSEHLNALSDGAIPARSNDRSIPRFTWWDHRGGREWVTYRFKQARTVSSCEVYWFDDSGMGVCRVPVSWEVFYWYKGGWMPVRATSDYPTEKDRFNRVTFEPVRAEVLRIEVHMRDGFSAGILEWRVGAE